MKHQQHFGVFRPGRAVDRFSHQPPTTFPD